MLLLSHRMILGYIEGLHSILDENASIQGGHAMASLIYPTLESSIDCSGHCSGKNSYRTPHLLKYGSIAKLTLKSGCNGDGGQNKKEVGCLSNNNNTSPKKRR